MIAWLGVLDVGLGLLDLGVDVLLLVLEVVGLAGLRGGYGGAQCHKREGRHEEKGREGRATRKIGQGALGK